MFTQLLVSYRSFFWGFIILLEAGLVGCGAKDTSSVSVKNSVDKLNKGDFVSKRDALHELEELGTAAKSAVPILIKILEDDSTPIPGAVAAVEQKRLSRIECASPVIRSLTASVLGEIGPDAKPAIPALLVALKDKSAVVRMASVKALAHIGENEERILSALKGTLDDPSPRVKRAAAMALSELNPESQEVIPTLTKMLKEKDLNERISAVSALGAIPSKKVKAAIPELLIVLKDSDERVRARVAASLGSICEEPRVVVPALIERLEKDQSSRVRIQAAQALREFGPEAKGAIPALTLAEKADPDSRAREIAASAIWGINTMLAKRGRKGSEQELLQMGKNHPITATNPATKRHMDKLRRRLTREKEKSAMLELEDPEFADGERHRP